MSAPDSILKTKPTEAPENKEKTNSLKRPSILLNKIETSKIPAVISIFGLEQFSLNACLTTNIPSNNNIWDICTQNTSGSNVSAPKKIDPIDANLDKISQYLGKNNSVKQQNMPSYEYKTLKEFKNLYFPERLTKQEMKLMIKVFRFVFGDVSSTIDRSILLQLLTPFDKIPCNEEGQEQVWKLFHDCLEYRIKGAHDLGVPTDTIPEYTYGEDTYVVTIDDNEKQKSDTFLQSIDPKLFTIKKEAEKNLLSVFDNTIPLKAEDKLLKVDGNPVKELPRQDTNEKHIYLLVKKNKLKKAYKKSPGLNRELALLAKTNPKINKEYEDKMTLKAQIYRMISILKEPRRSCIVFSGNGAKFHLNAYHTAILDLIRKTVTGFLEGNIPNTDEEKQKHFEQLLRDIQNLKEEKGDNKAIYTQMLEVVKTVFDKLKGVDANLNRIGNVSNKEDDAIVFTKLKGIDNGLIKLRELLDDITPTQKGGGEDDDMEEEFAEAQEEYERVFTTAMGHLDGLSRAAKEELLEEVLGILGGNDLESAVESAVSRKGFSLQSIVRRLNEIGGLTKYGESFIRCVETLLEIKERQHVLYVMPNLSPGHERYEYTMSKYPSLKQYIPKDVFRQKEFKDLYKLRRIYPYTDMLIEDIHIIRKQPDPICLFYSGNLMKSGKRARTACKKIVDIVPQCEKLLEEVLEILSKESNTHEEGLTFKEIALPKGFSVLAEAIRENLPFIPSLPITIHESCPKEYERVMGNQPFLLIGTGTTLYGVNHMEIDISDEIDEIRKGEISLGSVMFIYLYIKCDNHIDAR
jgi:hypothetical protein